jgi:hypothetical protein
MVIWQWRQTMAMGTSGGDVETALAMDGEIISSFSSAGFGSDLVDLAWSVHNS